LRVDVENETTARGIAERWLKGPENILIATCLHHFYTVQNSTADR
jgi:hypothetical protein